MHKQISQTLCILCLRKFTSSLWTLVFLGW